MPSGTKRKHLSSRCVRLRSHDRTSLVGAVTLAITLCRRCCCSCSTGCPSCPSPTSSPSHSATPVRLYPVWTLAFAVCHLRCVVLTLLLLNCAAGSAQNSLLALFFVSGVV